MASRSQTLTAEPTALAGLVSGRRYTLQNLSRYEVWVAEAATAPGDNATAFKLDPDFERIIEKPGTEEIYIWAKGSGALSFGHVVYAEAP